MSKWIGSGMIPKCRKRLLEILLFPRRKTRHTRGGESWSRRGQLKEREEVFKAFPGESEKIGEGIGDQKTEDGIAKAKRREDAITFR